MKKRLLLTLTYCLSIISTVYADAPPYPNTPLGYSEWDSTVRTVDNFLNDQGLTILIVLISFAIGVATLKWLGSATTKYLDMRNITTEKLTANIIEENKELRALLAKLLLNGSDDNA